MVIKKEIAGMTMPSTQGHIRLVKPDGQMVTNPDPGAPGTIIKIPAACSPSQVPGALTVRVMAAIGLAARDKVQRSSSTRRT